MSGKRNDTTCGNITNPKKKRKWCTLEVKLDIIKRAESGQRAAHIGRVLGLPPTTVRSIVKDAAKYKEFAKVAPVSAATKSIRKRSSVMINMEKLLSIWIKDNIQKRIPLSQAIIQSKAASLFESLKQKEGEGSSEETFIASRGWFENFKKRSGLHSNPGGETASADEGTALTCQHILNKRGMQSIVKMNGLTVIDLRSDTVTKPTPTMRKAMAEAEVGDDVYREDPTVLKLEQKTAELLGKEAALYFPSGTMANLAAIMAHCWERGSEILVGDMSHIYLYEQGGAAQLAGVHTRALTTKPDGTFDLGELISKIRAPNVHHPNTALICLENTHNRCGGAVLTQEYIEKVSDLAKKHNIPVHMDGARIMNAAVKLGVPAASLLVNCDSVSTCLSKGLGAPVGSLVVGSSSFIERLLRCRKVLGGGMRQAGILAAAGLVAITTMVDRLKEDHEHAQKIGKAIYNMKSEAVKIDLNSIQTNIILIDVDPHYCTAQQFQSLLLHPLMDMPVSLKTGVISPTRLRCVLHADICSSDVDLAIKKLQRIARQSVYFLKFAYGLIINAPCNFFYKYDL